MDKYILFAGRRVPIQTNFDVIRFDDERNPSFYKPENTLSPERVMQMAMIRPTMRNFSQRSYNKRFFDRTPEQLFGTSREEIDQLGQAITQIALHHDVTSKALDTFNVLCTRGLSTHFVVNYDGALYQFMDCYHVAWATGDNNNMSIAIDMNNPVFPELKNDDPASGLRDIYQGKINGSVKTMLGYTDAQYDTLIALIKALITPISYPGDSDPWTPLPVVADNCFPPISETGEVINRLLKDSIHFKGMLGHYHCSANKWDPGPAFDWMRVLSGIKGKRNSFPLILHEDRLNLSEAGGHVLESLLDRYYLNAESSEGGWYPIGVNQSWHSGIHLSAPEGTPILSMMEGTIVAVRNVKMVDLGDPSFVLIKHEREETGPDGDPRTVKWFSLYMHLEQMMDPEKMATIPWMGKLLGNEFEIPDEVAFNFKQTSLSYEKGVPQSFDGTVRSKNPKKLLESFFKGDIILTNIPVDAGEQLGYIGRFGNQEDHKERQVHIEVMSEHNLFTHGSAQNEAWNITEGDNSNYSLVKVKRILKPINEYVEQFTGRVPTFLKSSEIQSFFAIGSSDPLAPRRDSFRKMICFHHSEWSPLMNWTKTAIQTVGWQWESESSFGQWLLKWLPFQWMTAEVTSALKLPKSHQFFTYHPIYMLEQLNQSYAGDIRKTAEEASDTELRNNAAETNARLDELVALNKRISEKREKGETVTEEEMKRQEELYQQMDDHLNDQQANIETETSYDYYRDRAFEEWAPGEWLPPPSDDKLLP